MVRTPSSCVPAVSYSCVGPSKGGQGVFEQSAIAVGEKSMAHPEVKVDSETKFPASSLSKVVFTYLVLELVEKGILDLDTALYDGTLENERFKAGGLYPDNFIKLTARHVLSHTTGLPNVGGDPNALLKFSEKSVLGTGYSYSGEAIFYLQQVIEHKTGTTLEDLANEHVFTPLAMTRSSFLPGEDTNIVDVHTELKKPQEIYVGDPPSNAAGSLLTTGEDLSKFMCAWLEKLNNPLFAQAFEPVDIKDVPNTCGLGWHIYIDPPGDPNGDRIAYQYGENLNTQSFMAINVTKKTGVAFLTNSDNGMTMAPQLFNSPNLAFIGDMEGLWGNLHYERSDALGWQATMAGRIAEEQGDLSEARRCFEKAIAQAPENQSKKLRLMWFNELHPETPFERSFTKRLSEFDGEYTNQWGSRYQLRACADKLVLGVLTI